MSGQEYMNDSNNSDNVRSSTSSKSKEGSNKGIDITSLFFGGSGSRRLEERVRNGEIASDGVL